MALYKIISSIQVYDLDKITNLDDHFFIPKLTQIEDTHNNKVCELLE